MKDQLESKLRYVWVEFRAFTPGQKAVSVAAVLAAIIGAYFYLTYQATPTYAPLYTNLAASDASAIVDKLNSAGVPYQLGQAGTEILVPQNKVYSTRLTVSAAGLPSSSQTGYSLLDKEGVTTSEFKQQIDYQRAIEGELTNTIQSMTGVQAASVHLAIPQQNVFNDGSQQPTAAVLLTLTQGTQLTSQQVQSIVSLVSSSVPGLSANSVTVTDSGGQLLASPGSGVAGTGGSSSQTQATQDYNSFVAAQLQNLITPVVGAGHAVVSVNAQLDFSKKTSTTKGYIWNPKAPPLSQTSTKEVYKGTGPAAGGTLGAGTAATGGTTTTTTPGSYTKSSSTRDNALGTKTDVTQVAPGGISKMGVAVLLDSSVKGVALAKVRSLISSAAIFTPARGDTLSLQAMPFNNSAAKAATAAAAAAQNAAAAKASQGQLASMIKQGVLAVAVLGVVLWAFFASKRRRRAPEEPGTPMDDLFDDPMPVGPPQLDPIQVSMMNEAQEAAARKRALVSLAEDQPRDVASVLSGWLNTGEGDHARAGWNPSMANTTRTK